jgi:hypothetical protein
MYFNARTIKVPAGAYLILELKGAEPLTRLQTWKNVKFS